MKPVKNRFAVALGKLAKGKKKTLSPEQKKALADRLAVARLKRWTEENRKKIKKSA